MNLQVGLKKILSAGLLSILMLIGYFLIIDPSNASVNQVEPSQIERETIAKNQDDPDVFPHWIVVPSEDGSEIFVIATKMTELLSTTVVFHYDPVVAADFDGTTHEWSRSPSYSTTVQGAGYFDVLKIPEGESVTGELTMTINSKLATTKMELSRYFISSPTAPSRNISSRDGQFETSIPNDNTFSTSQLYLTLMVNDFLPEDGELPAGSQPMSKNYTLRPSNSDLTTEKPIIIRLNYNQNLLEMVDPFMLGIFKYDANLQEWREVGSTLFTDQQYLSAGTDELGTYILLAATRWYDDFDDFEGLSTERSNVSLDSERLVLRPNRTTGFATSRPITPTSLASWGTITYAATVEGSGSSISIDVIDSQTGAVLKENVASGADLSDIDVSQVSALQLRAELTRADDTQTVAIDEWKLTWSQEASDPTAGFDDVFLPFIQN